MRKAIHRIPIRYLQMGYSMNFLWSVLFIPCVARIVKYSKEILEESGCEDIWLSGIHIKTDWHGNNNFLILCNFLTLACDCGVARIYLTGRDSSFTPSCPGSGALHLKYVSSPAVGVLSHACHGFQSIGIYLAFNPHVVFDVCQHNFSKDDGSQAPSFS